MSDASSCELPYLGVIGFLICKGKVFVMYGGDILPRLKSWASSPYFMACSSCFSGDRFHAKSYIVSTGVNSGQSDRTETGI